MISRLQITINRAHQTESIKELKEICKYTGNLITNSKFEPHEFQRVHISNIRHHVSTENSGKN